MAYSPEKSYRGLSDHMPHDEVEECVVGGDNTV